MFKKQGIHILESNLAICNKSFKNDPPHRTTGEAQASTTAVVHHIVAEGKVRWEPLDSFFYVSYTLETKRRPKVTSRPNTALCPSCVAHEAALEQSCAHLFMCLLSMAASRPQQPGEQASRCMWRSLLFATTNCPDTVKTWKCFKCHQYCNTMPFFFFLITSAHPPKQEAKKRTFMCCAFKAQQNVDDSDIKRGGKALCLSCNDPTAVLKVYVYINTTRLSTLQNNPSLQKSKSEKLHNFK